MTRVVLITGPPGVGKTSVAQRLVAQLLGTSAYVCGDVFVLAVRPFEVNDDRRRFLQENLGSFVQHAAEHGYDWVVLDGVIPSDEFIDGLIRATGLSDQCVAVFALVADEPAYAARLKAQLEAHEATVANLRACSEWMERIRALRLPTAVDTSRTSPEDAATAILRLLAKGCGPRSA